MRPVSACQPLAGFEPASVMRIFSGRTVKRFPPRSTTFETPTKPATNSFAGRSYTSAGAPICSIRPFVEDRQAVAHRERLVLVVRDVDERDREILLEALQEELHLLAQLQVERAERLVEEQHLGAVDERAGERDPLALAAGELRRLALADVGKPHPLGAPRPRVPAAPCAAPR